MRARIRTLTALVLLAAPACASLEPPPGSTTEGAQIHGLWRVFLWAAVAVAAVVYGLIGWAILRYRRTRDGDPPQVRSNVPVEIVYTALPIVMVAALFVLTLRTETEVGRIAPDAGVTIHVRAFDWSWRFDYEDEDVSVFGTPDEPPQMVVPVGERIHILLTSSDVIHAFYVPEFLFKRDAIPGFPNEFDLTVDEPGVYRGQCAEFCGLDHARMRFSVRAVPRAEFDAWLEASREEAVTP